MVALGHGVAPLELRGDQPVPEVVTPRLRHVPTAFHPGHCVSGSQGWPPPSAATASAARSVLDGREHGGTLSRIGDDLPNSASRILYSLRERELEVHGTPACAAIKCCDRNAIKQRDPAYGRLQRSWNLSSIFHRQCGNRCAAALNAMEDSFLATLIYLTWRPHSKIEHVWGRP